MDKLTKNQLAKIENWVYENARPLEVAKWNKVWGKGTNKDVIQEMMKYQNPDGGFGNAFEADILLPQSSAIASAEAIFTVFNFELEAGESNREWLDKLLEYFINTKQDTTSYWEAVPPEIQNYPRPPWWNYQPDTKFTPNPCAVVAAAMLMYGNSEQKAFGQEIAEKCIALLKSNEFMGDHDIYCVQRLFIALQNNRSEIIDEEACKAMQKRILNGVSYNTNEWMSYVAQPLDFVDSLDSLWYSLLEQSIPENIRFWISNINNEGVWSPNFSWGVDTMEANIATKQWLGYIAVKRVKILKAFGCVE